MVGVMTMVTAHPVCTVKGCTPRKQQTGPTRDSFHICYIHYKAEGSQGSRSFSSSVAKVHEPTSRIHLLTSSYLTLSTAWNFCHIISGKNDITAIRGLGLILFCSSMYSIIIFIKTSLVFQLISLSPLIPFCPL